MFLKNISLVGFKNYKAAEVLFSSKINCLTGNNGVGKTNVLDAIYYLSFCKSFFSNVDAMSINYDEPLFVIQGNYNIDNVSESIYCAVERNKKKHFKRNKKEYEKLADHIGLIPLVMVSPSDISLILGGSDERRKFIDGIISQFDRDYLHSLQRYNKVLMQRNYLLKEGLRGKGIDNEMLSIYNIGLKENGQIIHEKRTKFIKEIRPVFQEFFTFIAGSNEKVSLLYNSQLNTEAFDDLLSSSERKDKMTGYTNVGIHKDELELLLGDHPIRKVGSQGQQKTYLVSLKMAQFEYIYKLCGFKPIMLLDDVFDKLDNARVEQIIKLVARNSFGQIFITDTNKERINKVLNQVTGEYFHFNVEGALINRIDEKA